jgi:hypothetical protein
MPTQNRVRRDDGRQLLEQPSAERLAFHRQSPPFIVGQQDAFLAELLTQELVFGE